METPLGRLNPAYVYGAIADLLALLIGFGLLMWTDVQQDLVLKFVGAIILAITGTAVGAAGAVNSQVQEALDTPAPVEESQSIKSFGPR